MEYRNAGKHKSWVQIVDSDDVAELNRRAETSQNDNQLIFAHSNNPRATSPKKSTLVTSSRSKTSPNYAFIICVIICCVLLVIAGVVGVVLLVYWMNKPQIYEYNFIPPESAILNHPNRKDVTLSSKFLFLPSKQRISIDSVPENAGKDDSKIWPFHPTTTIYDYERSYTVSRQDRLPAHCFVIPMTPTIDSFAQLSKAAEDHHDSPHLAHPDSWKTNNKWQVTVVAEKDIPYYSHYDGMQECKNGTVLLLQPLTYGYILGNVSRHSFLHLYLDEPLPYCSPSVCHELCLPEYGLDKSQHLSLMQRQCFSLYVPEWLPHASKDSRTNRLLMQGFYQGIAAQQQSANQRAAQQVQRHQPINDNGRNSDINFSLHAKTVQPARTPTERTDVDNWVKVGQ